MLKIQQDLKQYLAKNRSLGGGIELHQVYPSGGTARCSYQHLKIFAKRFSELKIGIDIRPGDPFKKGLDIGYIRDTGNLTPYTEAGWKLLDKIYNGEYKSEYRLTISWGHDGKPDYDMPNIIKDYLNQI